MAFRLPRNTCLLGVLVIIATLAPLPLAAAVLDGATQPKYVNPLPIPARIDVTAGGHIQMQMNETTQWLGVLDANNQPLMTTVWGYGKLGSPVSFPGPTLVTRENVPLDVTWHNNLPPYNFPNGPGAHLLPVDPNLHIAHPVAGGIPTVTHLHGGHTESASDGLPEQWFTQGFAETGPFFVKQKYRYDNDQEPATLWYHDHALGITRLNVYAGLAGFYLLRGKLEDKLFKSNVVPQGPYEIEVAIQDRMFEDTGALFYPSTNPEIEPGFDPLPPGPSAIAEFFGDFILVNGMAWPYLSVEPRKYRIRLLNGSDSRFYVLELRDDMMSGAAQPFLQIGTDDALLKRALEMDQLLIGPGERMDLVFDFSGYANGTELYLRNFGPDDPFKGFNEDGTISDGEGGAADPADPNSTGQIMKFIVELPDAMLPDASVVKDLPLRPAIKKLKKADESRQLVLFEGLDNYGRLQPLLGTLDEGSMAWFEPITENPMLDDVEIWEVYNATEDAHPIHLHLVAFQILNRQGFEGEVTERPQPQHDGSYGVGGVLTVGALDDDVYGPEPNEDGWKDTAIMLPGQVTRVIAKFDRPGRYVWHCHILSHEDHEMMRPFEVIAPVPAATAVVPQGDEVLAVSARGQVVDFDLTRAADIEMRVYNVLGQEVQRVRGGLFDPGSHTLRWNGYDRTGRLAPSGMYFYMVRAGDEVATTKATILR